MRGALRKNLPPLCLLLLAGCLHPVPRDIEKRVCDLAATPLDLQPLLTDQHPPPFPGEYVPPAADLDRPEKKGEGAEGVKADPPAEGGKVRGQDLARPFLPAEWAFGADQEAGVQAAHLLPPAAPGKIEVRGGVTIEIIPPRDASPSPGPSANVEIAWRKEDGKGKDAPARKTPPRLELPPELLPGGAVPPLRLPPVPAENDPRRAEKEAERRRALEQLYPPLPPLGDDAYDPPGPAGKPLTLSDLQKLAVSNSPQIKQAAARVEEARGAAIQAGLPPNPNLTYRGDSAGTTGGPGYQGFGVDQQIKTANKLQLARAAAACDVQAAELDLFKAQTDLATRVRGGYFAVLAAQESVRLNRALVRFTYEVYRIQADQVRLGGTAAAYEPMYLRALATQARANLVQARNRRTAAWKQLAANLGVPGMPPVQLAGRIDLPVPALCHREVLGVVLGKHSDLKRAEVAVQQARYQLELEKRKPIPDVNVSVVLQKDYTGQPFIVNHSVGVSVPVPVWDRNQGNILQAQAALERQTEEAHRARAALTGTLAEAFERYENGRTLLAYYRDQVLPDLVRVYRGVYERYRSEGGGGEGAPNFGEVVVAQQNLSQAVGSYLTSLGQIWQAVVDVVDLMQTPDLFGVNGVRHEVAALPDLEKLAGLPCCHPCSPVPNLHHRVLDGDWPAAEKAKGVTILPPVHEKRPEKLRPPKEGGTAPKEGGEGAPGPGAVIERVLPPTPDWKPARPVPPTLPPPPAKGE